MLPLAFSSFTLNATSRCAGCVLVFVLFYLSKLCWVSYGHRNVSKTIVDTFCFHVPEMNQAAFMLRKRQRQR